VVGWLGYVPATGLGDDRQLRFLKEQRLAFVLVAGIVVLLAAALSLLLARRLVRPLRGLAEATHGLTAGDFSLRVPVAGSDELGQLARDFNILALTLEHNEQSRRQWVADISHELRTPLAVLRGEIEALQDGVRPLDQGAMQSLHSEVLRLHRLVDDLYQLALSDLGALSYRKEIVDLAPLHYTDAGGDVVLRVVCDAAVVRVELEDSAPGVADADLARIFERLYRVEASRSRAAGGAGLGLAICRNIVEAHGGAISAHHSPMGGVLLRVELPRWQGGP
jgi:two-component system sensor histidine kinase BaeS